MSDNPTLRVVVAAALVSTHGAVLMQQRPAGKQHGGLWEFPGGKVESAESAESALVREIDEELGVGIDSNALFRIGFSSQEGVEGQRPMALLLFGATAWTGDPAPLEPGSRIAWVGPEALASLPVPPLDVPLLRLVIPLLEGLAKGRRHP